MKPKVKLVLQYNSNALTELNDTAYKVVKAVNTTEPAPGSYLNQMKINDYIRKGWTVEITEGR